MEEYQGFEEIARTNIISAVYLLLNRGKVVYVGQSVNIYRRVSEHFNDMRNHRVKRRTVQPSRYGIFEFDRVLVRFVPVDDLDREELELIQRYQPQHNTKYRNRRYINDPQLPRLSLSEIPGLVELTARVRAEREKMAPKPLKRRRITLDDGLRASA